MITYYFRTVGTTTVFMLIWPTFEMCDSSLFHPIKDGIYLTMFFARAVLERLNGSIGTNA